MNLQGRKVTIMGLGHFGGGAAAARWAARQGAAVTVTDLADPRRLADSLALLADEPIAAFHLGGHREEDFRRAEVVVVNPAVRPGSPWLKIAAGAGARLTSEIELFLRACPAPVVGVTGSNGKSTTAAMIASVLRADGRCTHLGGNLGGSLLEDLDHIGSDDWVVLELSSFQLRHLAPDTPAPAVAVVTNCTPNHLDWHGDFACYVAAKQRILRGQAPGDLAVLNPGCAEVASWAGLVQGRQLPWVDAAGLPELPVPGEHNLQNAACAAAAGLGAGCDWPSIEAGLASYRPLPGRLELVATVAGRRFYNDTTATTPESTIAALASIEGPMWLVAGGRDKGLDFAALAGAIVRRARGAAFFGAVGQSLRRQVAGRADGFCPAVAETMQQALDWCWERSQPGESIVLSPACASYDQFQDFRHRGAAFNEAIAALAGRCHR